MARESGDLASTYQVEPPVIQRKHEAYEYENPVQCVLIISDSIDRT
jgi:hypothetical protein